MYKLSSKKALVNELFGVQDTKVCLTDILTLKRTLTLSTIVSNNDMCLLKYGVLHATSPPVHFHPDSI